MKDNKRKYELSYFMKYGGSPAPGSYLDPFESARRMQNLNNELNNLAAKEAAKEAARREREEAEREQQQFDQILKQSGVSPAQYSNFVLRTSAKKAEASISSTQIGPSSAASVPKTFIPKEEKRAQAVNFVKQELKGISKSEKQVEKQQQASEARMSMIRNEKEDERKQRLEIIASISQDNGLKDMDVILIKDLYCSNPKQYDILFDDFFLNKFTKYFSEIDELRRDSKIFSSIEEQAKEILIYTQKSSLNTNSLISELKEFAKIFRRGTDFDIASNSLFISLHDEFNKLEGLSEMNFKDLEKVLRYLNILQEWLLVTYGEKLEIKVDSKLTSDTLQEYLNNILNILGEKSAILSEFNLQKFKDLVRKKILKLLLEYSGDKLVAPFLSEGNTKAFKKKLEDLQKFGLLTEEEIKELYRIKDSKNKAEKEQIDTTGLTKENIIGLKFRKKTKNEDDRGKIVGILSQPQERLDIMLGHLTTHFSNLKTQSGGLPDNSTVKTPENWEDSMQPIMVPNRNNQITQQNRVAPAENSENENSFVLPKSQIKKIKKDEKKQLLIDSKKPKITNSIQRYLNNKENTIYLEAAKKFLENPPKRMKIRRQDPRASFPNFRQNASLNNSNRPKFTNEQIMQRNDELKDPNTEHKFSTMFKIIEQIKAMKLKKEKKITELVKRLNTLNTEKNQPKINRITSRINKLAEELQDQEEDDEVQEKNNENSFVLMISPTQRLSDLSVTISGKTIKIEYFMNIYKKIDELYEKIFMQQAYINIINELKHSIFDNIKSNSSFRFEHDISQIILNLLNEQGFPNLFVDQLLELNEVPKIIHKIIKILKMHLCNIADKEEYNPEEYYRELLEQRKQRLMAKESRTLPPLFAAFQGIRNGKNQTVEKSPVLKRLLTLEGVIPNSSASSNSASNNSAPNSSAPNNSASNNSASNNSARGNSENNSSAKSSASTATPAQSALTQQSKHNKFNPVVSAISKKDRANLQKVINDEKAVIAAKKVAAKDQNLEDIITDIKYQISGIELNDRGNVPEKLRKAIQSRIQRIPQEKSNILDRKLTAKIQKLQKAFANAAAKAAANAAAKAAAKAASNAAEKNKPKKSKKPKIKV